MPLHDNDALVGAHRRTGARHGAPARAERVVFACNRTSYRLRAFLTHPIQRAARARLVETQAAPWPTVLAARLACIFDTKLCNQVHYNVRCHAAARLWQPLASQLAVAFRVIATADYQVRLALRQSDSL